MTSRLSTQDCIEILRLHKQGLSQSQIARVMGRSWGGVKVVLRPTPTMKLDAWDPSSARRSMREREEIRAGLVCRETLTAICRLDWTVGLYSVPGGGEQRRSGDLPGLHGASPGSHRIRCSSRSTTKEAEVGWSVCVGGPSRGWLVELWFPEQIARRLRIDSPSDPMMWMSHETIYQSLFVQGRGALRRELSAYLRTGRAVRQPATRVQRRASCPRW